MRTEVLSIAACGLGLAFGCYSPIGLNDAGPSPDSVDASFDAGQDLSDGVSDATVGQIDALPDAPVSNVVPGCASDEQSGPLTSNYSSGKPESLEVFTSPPALAVFTNGVMKLVPATSNAEQYASAHSLAPGSFARRRIATEVPVMVSTAKPIDAYLSIYSTDNDMTFLEISQYRGSLRANSWVDLNKTILVELPYDQTAHRWWQIREADGVVTFETSSDGISWVQQTTTPTPAWYRTANLGFHMYANRAISGDAGQLHFDNTFDCKR